jgi:hypothetical protein
MNRAPAETIADLVNDVYPARQHGRWPFPCTVEEVLEVRAARSQRDAAAFRGWMRAPQKVITELVADLFPSPKKAPSPELRVVAELVYAKTASLTAVMDVGLSYGQARNVVRRMAA